MWDQYFSVVFFISLSIIFYIYAGFPLTLLVLNKIFKHKDLRSQFDGTVSVIVVGYNEAHRLGKKIESILASDINSQITQILIGSDGSDDQTADVISQIGNSKIKHVHFPVRRGKPSVINDLIPMCTGDIIVLTDARQVLATDGIRLLVEKFADPKVGVVSGELQLIQDANSKAAADGIGFYWKYEKMIRKAESRFRSVPGATGAFYAIRRSLFKPIPANTILDDVMIPMLIIEQGYRCLLASRAYAYDLPSQSTSQEAIRKRRTIAGSFQLLLLRPDWIFPWCNPLWWEFTSHKIGRLISPICLLLIAITNLCLMQHSFFQIMLCLQVTGYAAAFIGYLHQIRGIRSRIFGPFLMFVSLNITTAFAFLDAVRGRFRSTWQRAS